MTFPHTVDLRFPNLWVVARNVTTDTPLYDDNEDFQRLTQAREWCETNVKGEWSHTESTGWVGFAIYDPNGNQIVGDNSGLWQWSFERQEDAALFRMFWS